MVITKCEFRYMKFAKSISHGVCWISVCWKPGSKKAPSELLEVDHVVGVGEGVDHARVGDPADHLVAVVGEEEEHELAAGVEDALRQQPIDPGHRPRAPRADCKGPVSGAGSGSPRKPITRSTASGRSSQGQWPAPVELEELARPAARRRTRARSAAAGR